MTTSANTSYEHAAIFPVETAIVTVTYNCAAFIETFLRGVADHLRPANAVLIIVDNASSDDTVDVVRRFADEYEETGRIVLQAEEDNHGFGTGCNIGVGIARTYYPEFYWFLNPDTQVFGNTYLELLNFFRDEPSADFVGSQLVDENGVTRPSAFRFPSVASEFCRSVRLGVLDRLLPNGQLAIPVSKVAHRADWLTGASFMVRSRVFDELNGFDPQFFLYFEEVDLFYRARERGFVCWFNPKSKVYHFAGASTGISSARKAVSRRPKYWFESRRYFYCKNFGRAYFALCDLAAIIGLSLWQVRSRLQKKESMDPPDLLKDIAANSIFCSRDRG